MITSYEAMTDGGKLIITIDEDVCSGLAQCMVYAAKTFDLNDDMTSFVKENPSDSAMAVRAAVESCPNRAITLTEADNTGDATGGRR